MKNNNNKKNVTMGTLAVFIICSALAIFFPGVLGEENTGSTPATAIGSAVVEQDETWSEPEVEAADVVDDAQEEFQSAPQDEQPEEMQEEAQETLQAYDFRSEKLLNEHYEKHGVEMGFDSAEAYLEAANKVLSNPDVLHKKEAEDGDDVYYLEETNEFVVVSTDGYIRTYFYPSAGIDYFNRQ